MKVVYKIQNKINGKIYIGKSVNLTHRWYCHKRTALHGRGYFLHRAIRKHGKHNFTVEVLHKVFLKEKLNDLEIKAIKKFKSNDRRYGYNLTAGGDGSKGLSPSKFIRAKIGKANRGKKRTKSWLRRMSRSLRGRVPGFIGKKHSKSSRRKISRALTGLERPTFSTKVRRNMGKAAKRAWAKRKREGTNHW